MRQGGCGLVRINKPTWGTYLVMCIVLMVCTTAFFLLRERAQIWRSATQNSLAAAIGRQSSMSSLLAQSVASIEGIQNHLQLDESAGGNEAIRITRSAMSFDPLSSYLGFRDRISGRYFVMDRQGHLVNTAVGRNLATQMHMPSSDKIEILPLVQLPNDEAWYMPLVLTISGYDTEADLTFALISVDHLVNGAAHLKTMPGSFLAIIKTDGRYLLRLKRLGSPQDINGPPVSQAIMAQMRKHRQGSFEDVTALDGVRSIFGYSVSDTLPFQVVIGVPVNSLYERWATQSIAPLIVLLVSISLIAWLGSRLKGAFRQLQATTTEQAYAARHDKLTGLLSRDAFIHDVSQQMAADSVPGESSAAPTTVMLLNLNRFKDINDTLGHEAGDSLLVEVGRRLTESLAGSSALIARLGGDEFAVYMNESTASDWLSLAPHSGYAQVSRRLLVHRSELEFSASIGYASWPQDAANTDELLRCADVAMNFAKQNLKPMSAYLAAFDSFSPDMLDLRVDFIKALRSNGLSLEYQAKVKLSDGALIGVEALARWVHPNKGNIPPLTFIPLAENSELIHDFTHFVLEAALLQAKAWAQAGHPLPVAVNLSVNNLLDHRFVERLDALLKRVDVSPNLLEIEVTESAVMRHPELTLKTLHAIRDMGLRLSIDDFGTGYASLAYLKQLPVHCLKIDRGFIDNLEGDDANRRIVKSSIQLAHEFNLDVVAEGVEDAAAAALLRDYGCEYAQGYFFARPVSAAALAERWWPATTHASTEA